MTDNMELAQLVVGMVATNCYIAKNKKTNECIVVDPSSEISRIQAEIVKMGSPKVAAVLLTHGHFDHAGEAEAFAKANGDAPIYAAEAERETLENPRLNLSGPMAGNAASYHATNYLKDEQEVDLAGFHIRMLLTPGHTAGGCCYYIGTEDLLFSGDTLFCGSVGRTDFPGGSMSEIVRSIKEKLMILPDQTLVLPGHESRTSIEDERMYNPYL